MFSFQLALPSPMPAVDQPRICYRLLVRRDQEMTRYADLASGYSYAQPSRRWRYGAIALAAGVGHVQAAVTMRN
jgi:hypothetical protein